jgi:hypothetical protein
MMTLVTDFAATGLSCASPSKPKALLWRSWPRSPAAPVWVGALTGVRRSSVGVQVLTRASLPTRQESVLFGPPFAIHGSPFGA